MSDWLSPYPTDIAERLCGINDKMRIKYLTSILILLVCLVKDAKSMGLGDWQHKTENGIVLHNSYGPTYIEWDDKTIENVGKWYYYKNHIIGITNTKSWQTDTTKYFILNEVNKDFYITASLTDWQERIEKNNLNPLIPRWFESHMSNFIFFFVAAYYWYISIPILLIILYIFYRLIYSFLKSRFDLKNPSEQILLLILIVAIFMYWKSINYNSI